jgi:hypothetical protein
LEVVDETNLKLRPSEHRRRAPPPDARSRREIWTPLPA